MKILKGIAIVAGAAALIATGLGAVGVGAILGASTTAIAGIASLAAGVANIGVSLLTKPPPARGSVTQLQIAVDAATPYVMGEGYFAGVLRYQRSYGATLDKVPNPYRWKVVVYSGGGPVQSITPQVEFATIGSYYSTFLYTDTQLGTCPESTALVPNFSGAPDWGSASKLSGKAAIGWNLKFDKAGKVFASGEPALGALIQGVKVYDPRLDSTFPGGSGACRLGNESTYVYSQNPALHAGTYAYGRFQNGKRVLGIGLPGDAIDWVNVAAWASVCDTNGWTMFGVVYEGGPGDQQGVRWANLRDICLAGGAEPILSASALHFHYFAPAVSLDTITIADLVADAPRSVVAMAAWRERLNTVIPRRISADHNWQSVQDDAVQVSTYLADDGEEKATEWAFNFVKDADQAAQLARYKLEYSRQFQPIDLTCTQRMRAYRPGDRLTLDLLDELGLDCDVVVLNKQFDPDSMAVQLVCMRALDAGEHAFALGQTGTAPPAPALGHSAEERDAIAAAAIAPPRGAHRLSSYSISFLLSSDNTSVSVEPFTGVVDDGRTISVAGHTFSSLTSGTNYAAFYKPSDSSFAIAAHPATTEMADSDLVFLGWQETSVSGVWSDPETAPGGYGGIGSNYSEGRYVLP